MKTLQKGQNNMEDMQNPRKRTELIHKGENNSKIGPKCGTECEDNRSSFNSFILVVTNTA